MILRYCGAVVAKLERVIYNDCPRSCYLHFKLYQSSILLFESMITNQDLDDVMLDKFSLLTMQIPITYKI